MGDVEIKLDFAATQIEQAKIVFGLDDQPEQRRISFSEVINGLDGRNALPLLGRGVVLRFHEKRMSDATLKLRAPDGAINAAAWKTKRACCGAPLCGERTDSGRSPISPAPSSPRPDRGSTNRSSSCPATETAWSRSDTTTPRAA